MRKNGFESQYEIFKNLVFVLSHVQKTKYYLDASWVDTSNITHVTLNPGANESLKIGKKTLSLITPISIFWKFSKWSITLPLAKFVPISEIMYSFAYFGNFCQFNVDWSIIAKFHKFCNPLFLTRYRKF